MESSKDLEREQADAAAAEAARIGGGPGSEGPLLDEDGEPVDEARRPLAESGQGFAEGFETAEQELVDHASHGDQHAAGHVLDDASATDDDDRGGRAGAADAERSSELEADE